MYLGAEPTHGRLGGMLQRLDFRRPLILGRWENAKNRAENVTVTLFGESS